MAAYKSLCMKGDEYVVGIELPIIQVLSTSENPTDDVIEFPTDLKISTSMPRATEDSTSRMREIGEQLNFLLEKIMNWNYIRLKTWERSLGIVAECVQDIEEMQRLVESLGCLSLNGYEEKDGIPHRVYSILQMALSRVEEEFSHILCESRQPLEPENFSFCSKADAISFLDSIAALNSQLCEDTQVEAQRDNTRGLKEHIINLVHPNIIPILKCMAEVLFVSGYGAKCCQTYIGIRKDVLEECLLVLEVEKFRIEDVLQMDWRSLNSKIKKWIRAVKIFVTVYLASEKSLAHKIFGISGSVGRTCFIEASKGLILQLLSFGKAVATKNHAPENIVPILYMYEGLLGLLSNIQVLFLYEAGSAVSTDAHEILTGLGEAARRSLNDFKDVIRKNKSSSPFAGSGVHHLTMIVMSYLKTLTNHSDTLDILLKRGNPQEDNRDYHSPSSSIVNIAVTDDDSEWSSSHVSPIAWYLQSMISMLESNLENKSQLYTDVSLKHFFLMNNIFYMAQQVKESKLGPLLGENWIQEHNEKYQWHAENYESASWSPVLSFLRDEGIHIPQPGSFSKASLKVRFQCFKLAFEEIYGTQTAWFIPDAKLRQDLRISISLKLLQAFQMFLAMYFSQLPRKRHGDNYIKYCSKDLQGFLLDLFEGSPRSFAKSPSLKEEFSLILIENKRPLEPEHLPFQSSDEDLSSVDLNASADDEPSQSTKCMMSALELNLESKSQVYKDVSQQHFFLMNNICYMVQKVKDSELEPLLGESWLRKQDGKFLQHSLNYERNSWSPVLSLLRHEGIWNRRSGAVSKAILKERILGFNLAFEEIYRTQRKWLIQNAQLRDHLRISISSKVFLAYTSFLERYSSQLPGRNIKYRAEDLLESLLDLFEGSPKPLHRSHRR
ncbi:hypothetical protein ACLOJK_035597 [Asimina triloba]